MQVLANRFPGVVLLAQMGADRLFSAAMVAAGLFLSGVIANLVLNYHLAP